ncbi:MAG: relaxase/mobilization nuclease domain-containing protein [Ruminococcus sp.]|nr:relaxase/mobilization nuclease domain-containing protein [Ruminococcus sp.]
MSLFKGVASKAKPSKAIKYITNPKKAAIVVTHGLDDSLDYSVQFADTQSLFGKAKSFGNRKYYHFKHSFDPKDNVSPAKASEMTEELASKVFDDYEYIIATHTDKAHIHCHLIVNSVSFVTGKMLHLNNTEYGELKDLSNSIAEKHGYSTLDFRKKAADRISSKEKQITLNGGTSWKEELREVIAIAVHDCTTMEEFESYINDYGVTITRNTAKTISFKHPNKQKTIRGDKLGADYTEEAILNELEKSSYRNGRANKTTDGHILSRTGGRYNDRIYRRTNTTEETDEKRTDTLFDGRYYEFVERHEIEDIGDDDDLFSSTKSNSRGR